MNRPDELDAFKRNINLMQYAASHGYRLNRSASSRNCAVMSDFHGKIVVVMASNGHWLYFSVHEEQDNGSIVDFVQNRRGFSLGEVRKELRPWLEAPPISIQDGEGNHLPILEPIPKETASVQARIAAMAPVTESDFLTQTRGISAEVIQSDRFAGRILTDDRGNSVFPHYGLGGICGYEIKNLGFTGFSPGGSKGLWCSRGKEDDSTLVIGEGALDVLSYVALHANPRARYVSTGGTLNPTQPELIKRAVAKIPVGSEIILAMDNDKGGELLAAKITESLPPELIEERILRIDKPHLPGEDWNDVLRSAKS